MLREVSKHTPTLLPWALSCYTQHSSLFCQGHSLSSQQGVQQGDPLGPLFFALGWQPVVEAITTQCDLEWLSFYLDDGVFVGPLAELNKVMSIVSAMGADIEVEVNLAKCNLWGPAGPVRSGGLLGQVRRLRFVPGSGVEILGVPVCYPGSHEFAEEIFEKRVRGLEQGCELLGALGMPQIV